MTNKRQHNAKPKMSGPEMLTILFIISFVVALYVKTVFL